MSDHAKDILDRIGMTCFQSLHGELGLLVDMSLGYAIDYSIAITILSMNGGMVYVQYILTYNNRYTKKSDGVALMQRRIACLPFWDLSSSLKLHHCVRDARIRTHRSVVCGNTHFVWSSSCT